ncbi:MAG: alpha/beta hydrolase [Flavobacteriaceae bacterium]|nr:alpha/beta hydrolase [Flavobacteriaceae bacterium]
MEKIHLYFVPGLAASSKIFEHLTFPSHYEIHYLEWIDPIKNESIESYAKRLSALVLHQNPVLIGVSFGGIIVQEMKKCLQPQKTIIVSSIKTKFEHSYLSRLAKSSKIYRLFPFLVNHALEFSLRLVFGKRATERIGLYNLYLSKRDYNYLQWSLSNVLNWKRENADPEIVHIHGNKDEVFPIKYIKNCIIVENGRHIMILNKSKTISQLIQQNIESNEY